MSSRFFLSFFGLLAAGSSFFFPSSDESDTFTDGNRKLADTTGSSGPSSSVISIDGVLALGGGTGDSRGVLVADEEALLFEKPLDLFNLTVTVSFKPRRSGGFGATEEEDFSEEFPMGDLAEFDSKTWDRSVVLRLTGFLASKQHQQSTKLG